MPNSPREAARRALLRDAGWGEAQVRQTIADASPRSYERLVATDGARAVLMNADPSTERAICPPDATPQERAAMPYQAQARLAGLNIAAFVGLARALTARGFSAPRVLGADVEAGWVLLEDLGETVFTEDLARGADAAAYYGAAVDMLAAVRRATFPDVVSVDEVGGPSWPILTYDDVALHAEARLFLEHYLVHGDDTRPELAQDQGFLGEWEAVWDAGFAALRSEGPCLVLRDVHASNLIWLPDREGVARAGVIDFQDALFGHPAYDLVSLLEDARRDVEPHLVDPMLDRYVSGAHLADPDGFNAAYAVMGAQRNAKILGVFMRLEHVFKKPGYMTFLPRVERLFAANLRHPALADLRTLTARCAPRLARS